MGETEAIRKSFKPTQVVSLFVGESAPRSGKFFYLENTNLFRELRKAFNAGPDFLREFQAEGFYLDDLVLEPVNGQERKEKREKHASSVDSLANRLAKHKPEAIVIIGIGIQRFVQSAARKAGFNGSIFVTAFPGRPKHKQRFYADMGEILPKLPRLRANKEGK